MTYEEILKRALLRVSNDIDKREGSVIYAALAPACFELALLYNELEYTKGKLSVENLEGDELTTKCKEQGVNRKNPSKALRRGIFNINVPLNSRFSIEDLIYTVKEKITDTEFVLECTQDGDLGNNPVGTLLPISYIEGLKSAVISDILAPGADIESDKSLKQRYYEKVRTPATSGNRYHYRNWAKEVVGVGDAKVIPLWNGKGTVKIVLVDTDSEPVTQHVVDKVFEYIEDVKPVCGGNLTVVSATSKPIDITAKVMISTGYTIQQVQETIKTNIEKYRRDIAFEESYVSFAAMGNIIFNTKGVVDYNDLKLNALTQNIALLDEEIPSFSIALELMI